MNQVDAGNQHCMPRAGKKDKLSFNAYATNKKNFELAYRAIELHLCIP